MFLKISSISQENTCTGISFLIRFQAWPTNLLQKRLPHSCEIFKKTNSVEQLQIASSGFWRRFISIFENSSENNFDKISSEAARKAVFCHQVLDLFWIYLRYCEWSALDEPMFFSIGFQHHQKKKVNFENTPIFYFIRNEKGVWLKSLVSNLWLVYGNRHEMLSLFGNLKVRKWTITEILSNKHFHISNIYEEKMPLQ